MPPYSSGMKSSWIPSSSPHMSADGVDRALVEVIQLEQALVGQVPRRELPDGLKGEVEGLAVETDYRSD